MKNNSKKHNGFSLIDVVISMALIAVISVGVYSAYLLLIKQTKAGAVRQSASLHGKEIIEQIIGAIESNNIVYSNSGSKSQLVINKDITLDEVKDDTESFIRTQYLDDRYKPDSESESRYTEIIKVEKAKADVGDNDYVDINLDKSTLISGNSNGNELYISEEKENGKINYYLNKEEKIVIESDKLILNIYIATDSVSSKKNIEIKDTKGTLIYNEEANINNGEVNIIINFSEYKQSESSNVNSLQINVYNRDKDIPNIYIEKTSNLKVDTISQKGQINIYDNRGGFGGNIKLGTLYDITVTIADKKNSNQVLFTGNSKQNIDIK